MKKLFILYGLSLYFASCGQVKKEKEPVVSVDTTVKEDIHMKVGGMENNASSRLTIFKKDGKELFIERDTSWTSTCYSVINGIKRKLIFNQDYLDDGVAELTYYAYDRFLYIVGDIKPNSNGWTCRYSLYRIDTDDFSMKHIYTGAAIRFCSREIVIADARLTNPDADCTADEIWVMHDVHFDVNGNRIHEDRKEYDFKEMERLYGKNLVNSLGMTSR